MKVVKENVVNAVGFISSTVKAPPEIVDYLVETTDKWFWPMSCSLVSIYILALLGAYK